MVKSLKFLRHRQTEAGYFSEFLIAKTPDDLENRQPQQRKPIIIAHQPPPLVTVAAAPTLMQPQVGFVSLYPGLVHHPATVARHEEVAESPVPLTPSPSPSPTSRQPQASFRQPQADPLRVARRRERNRTAAAKCRQRRQDRLECLAECVRQLEAANGDLESEVADLAADRARLEAAIRDHQTRCDRSPAATAAAVAAAAAAVALASPMEDGASVWLSQPPPPTPTLQSATAARPTSLSLSSDEQPPPSLTLTTPRCGGLTPLLATPQFAFKLESMLDAYAN